MFLYGQKRQFTRTIIPTIGIMPFSRDASVIFHAYTTCYICHSHSIATFRHNSINHRIYYGWSLRTRSHHFLSQKPQKHQLATRPLKPYAVVWVDPKHKHSTHVDEEGDESPIWDAKLVIPLVEPIEDSTLYIDVVHANAAEDIKPLIGSTKLKLKDIVDKAGIDEVVSESLVLKRPSGRPHGKLEVKVIIKESRYRAPDPYYPPPYTAQPSYHVGPPPFAGNVNYPYAAPLSGYPGGPPQAYGYPGYGGQLGNYDEYKEEKKSKYGMGTGLAVGAAAGFLGGLAIAEGVDYVEDQIAEDAAEKVEEDLGYDVDDD